MITNEHKFHTLGGESMSQDIKAVQIYTQAPPFSNIKEEEHRSNTNTLTPSATAHFLINDTNFGN